MLVKIGSSDGSNSQQQSTTVNKCSAKCKYPNHGTHHINIIIIMTIIINIHEYMRAWCYIFGLFVCLSVCLIVAPCNNSQCVFLSLVSRIFVLISSNSRTCIFFFFNDFSLFFGFWSNHMVSLLFAGFCLCPIA